MKEKITYYTRASFLALLFVVLGYTVKFYPEQLEAIDSPIQTAIRGSLPDGANQFWSLMTMIGEVLPILVLVTGISLLFYRKKWKAEAYFLMGGMAVMAGASTALKFLYQRPRPSLDWVVDTIGYSFPSWHTASTMMLAGILVIVAQQRIQKQWLRRLVQLFLIGIAILVALSRIYVGVHYPTDIVAGWLLAIFLLTLLYPFYDEKRFIWRFQGKQK